MQRVNRLLMLRARNLVGPFFQRVGANTYARSAGNFFGSGGGLRPPQFVLSIDQAAGTTAGIQFTTNDGTPYTVDWGDGTIETDVVSGVQATHTYVADYTGFVTFTYQVGSLVTRIENAPSTSKWTFDLADLPRSVTYLNVSVTQSAITGDIGANSTLTELRLYTTSSAITGDIGANSTLTYLQLSSTASIITGDIGVNSTLTYLHLSNTASIITGDLGANSALTNLILFNTPSAITGDIGANSTLTYLHLGSTASVITGGGASSAASFRYFNASNTSATSTNVDGILITLATIATWTNEKIVNLAGNNAARTSASDAAVTTLQGYGVTVTVNE